MSNSELKKKVFAGLILLVLLILAFLVVSWLSIRKFELIIGTQSYERGLKFSLEQRAVTIGTLSDISNGPVFAKFFGTNWFPNRTNTQGEILDSWNVSFQVEIVGQTNFVIQSAGPNQKFGDADDIVFNSASNDFVKP